MDDALRNRIRERLGHLQSENGEALFEKVCAELARKRIHANIRMNAFVAGHGDRGRDFENIPGQSLDLVMSLGREHGVSPSTQIVFACTLGRTRLSNKIKKDIDVIHAEGPKPDYIYHFCEIDFPTADQTELRLWCERKYNTRLEILTGNTIADVLAEADLLSIARDQLRIALEPSAPFVLPPVDTEGFVGRQEEIKRLSDLLINGEQAKGGRIAGLFGPPGVGKSGLAVHFARSFRGHFPGGVVGVDLRGTDDPTLAVARLAAAQGRPLTPEEQECPPHEVIQARFADRRCLVILDNVEDGSTLKQLKPGGQAALLITCRNQDVLAQFATPADHSIPLHMLSAPLARQYLETALGEDSHTPVEFDDLAQVLKYLPLALRIGARRLLEDPLKHGRIARFLARLRSAINPLDELIVQGEADMDLIRLFALSLEFLSMPEQRAFACLSVCATQDFGAKAANAAMGSPNSGGLLARFVRLSLIEVNQETARYRFHPLVDDYAYRLADRWALTYDARKRHAQAVAALLRTSANAQGAALLQLLEDQADIRQAAEYLVDHTYIDLPVLQGLNRLVEQTTLGTWHQGLLERAQQRLSSVDRNWFSGVLLLQQGKRAQSLGNLDEARDALEQSLEIERRLKNERGEAMVLNSLGGVLRDLGRMDEARDAFEQSLEIGRRLRDERSEMMVLNSLGGVLRDLGRMDEARDAFEQSLEISRRLRDERSERMVLNSLGGVLRDLGRTDEARDAFEQSLEIGRRLKDERSEAMVLNSLGGVLRDLGRMDEARDAFEQSLEIGRRLKNERQEAAVLNNLGWWFREQGEPEMALEMLDEYRRICKKLKLPIPAFFKNELKKLRKWVRPLPTGAGQAAEYHFAMARKRMSAKDWPGAIIHLRRILELDGTAIDRGQRLDDLAFAYFRAGRLPEAIAASEQALSADFESDRLYANLGRAVHAVGGTLAESESHLRRAVNLNPDNEWARSWLGLVLADVGNLEEAETHARTALDRFPNHAVLINNLALVLARYPDNRTDKLEEALRCLERAEQLADFYFPYPARLATELRHRLTQA